MTESKKKFAFVIFVVLGAVCFVRLIAGIFTLDDFATQWRICAYTLRGIDVYSLRGSVNFFPEIGEIKAGFHASPFGLILQNIFYGGFLPFRLARIYFMVVNFAVILAASCALYSKAKDFSRSLGILAFTISILSADFFIATFAGNAGGMICAFLLISWLIIDEHPYIAGVLIAFAMTKPQDALIVCVALLLMRKFVPVIAAALIDVCAWCVASFMLNKGMIELLREFLFMPSELTSRPPFAGIFTLLIPDFQPAMFASMIAGVIFVIVMLRFLPKDMPGIFRIYPAFMAITFWAYSYSNDCYVLILPACASIWLMLEIGNFCWLISALYCSSGILLRSIIARVFMLLSSGLSYTQAHVIARTIFEAGIIITGILLYRGFRRLK